MFSKVTLAAALLVVGANAQALLINTPTALITCQPYALTWSGGEAPYFVSVIPGGDQTAAALETIGEQPTTATTNAWTVDIAAGTSITMKVTDSTGTSAFSAPVTILAGSSTSCIGGGSSSSAAGSSSAAASSSSSAAPASSSSAAQSSSAAASSSSTSSAPASSSAVSTAVSASSAVSSRVSSATSAASSQASSATSSVASLVSSAAPTESSAPASGANKVALSGLAVLGAAALAIVA